MLQGYLHATAFKVSLSNVFWSSSWNVLTASATDLEEDGGQGLVLAAIANRGSVDISDVKWSKILHNWCQSVELCIQWNYTSFPQSESLSLLVFYLSCLLFLLLLGNVSET